MTASVSTQLEEDIDWRVAELATLKMYIAAERPGSTGSQAGLRAIWALLYAHYEGFSKFAWETYLDAIQREGYARSKLALPVALFSLSKVFKSHRGDVSASGIWEFHNMALPAALAAKAEFEVRLETQSNLWPHVLQENCEHVGITLPSLQEHYGKLRTLVDRRNQIAHGKRLIVSTLSEYEKYERACFDIMYELAYAVHDLVATAGYLAAGTAATAPPPTTQAVVAVGP